MENSNEKYKDIKGWGVDIDPKNEPNYPIKKYNGDDHNRLNWERPPLQPVTVEILKSVEHPRMPAVFGTPNPPSGLSGALRRVAFKYDESEYGHWLNLLLADRINVVEGVIDDIRHLRFPNIFSEKGMKADWKYNRKELVTKVVVATAVITAVCLLSSRKKKSKKISLPTIPY
jgi:hypothetical protein